MASREQADDKTGGDVNAGRLAPGAEGRGGNRTQRAPIIEGELKGELAKLLAQATTVSEFLGHEPIVWRAQPEHNAVSLRCSKCALTSGIALYPMAGFERINGCLFEEKCKR